MSTRAPAQRRPQEGAAAVEFALVISALLLLLIGIVELGRVFFVLNSAVEATRRGARLAAVSPLHDAAILADMQNILPDLGAGNGTLSIAYLPPGCTAGTCTYVQVGIADYTMTPLLWAVGPITVPPFATTLPVESLGQI